MFVSSENNDLVTYIHFEMLETFRTVISGFFQHSVT